MTESETLRMNCDGCNSTIRYPATKTGKAVKCPKCEQLLKLRGPSPPALPAQPPTGKSIAATVEAVPAAASESFVNSKLTCKCGVKFQASPSDAGKFIACPACGNVVMAPKPPKWFAIGCVGFLFLMCSGVLGSLFDDNEKIAATAVATDNAPVVNPPVVVQSPDLEPRVVAPPPERKWYEGGTLTNATALEWQQASAANKLATCSDFIAGLWQKEMLAPRVQTSILTVDDMKPFAFKLTIELNAAFEPEADPDLNRRAYANQTVAGTAAILMKMTGMVN